MVLALWIDPARPCQYLRREQRLPGRMGPSVCVTWWGSGNKKKKWKEEVIQVSLRLSAALPLGCMTVIDVCQSADAFFNTSKAKWIPAAAAPHCVFFFLFVESFVFFWCFCTCRINKNLVWYLSLRCEDGRLTSPPCPFALPLTFPLDQERPCFRPRACYSQAIPAVTAVNREASASFPSHLIITSLKSKSFHRESISSSLSDTMYKGEKSISNEIGSGGTMSGHVQNFYWKVFVAQDLCRKTGH